MAQITNTVLNQFLDGVNQSYVRALGSAASGLGVGVKGGSYGAGQSIATLLTNLNAAQDDDLSFTLLSSVRDMKSQVDSKQWINNRAGAFLSALQSLIASYQLTGVRTLDDYLTYQNKGAGVSGGVYWAVLQHPAWYDVYGAINSSVVPSINNLYYPILQSVYTNGLAKFVVSGAGAGAFTQAAIQTVAGQIGSGLIDDLAGKGKIDTAKYAGGNPQINMSGIAGSGNVTVTGDSYDPVNGLQTGKTWVTSVTGNGVTPMTVGAGTAPANSLITRVTAISIAAGITAGTFYIEAAAPSGRMAIP